MASDQEWKESFARLEAGQSYRDEAKELGCDQATVFRRHITWLQERVNAKAQELKLVEGAIEPLTNQARELEEKLKGSLRKSQDKLARTRRQVSELEKAAKDHGLGLTESLTIISKIKNLSSEIGSLSREKEALAGEVLAIRGILPNLRSRKGDLEARVRLLGPLQSSYDSLTAWNLYQRQQLESYKEQIESAIVKLEAGNRASVKTAGRLYIDIKGKEMASKMLDEKLAVSGIQVQAILTSASVQGGKIVEDSITKKGELEREIERGQDYLRELREEIRHVKLLRDIKGAVGAPRRGVDELGEGIRKAGEVAGAKKLPIGAALKLLKPSAKS